MTEKEKYYQGKKDKLGKKKKIKMLNYLKTETNFKLMTVLPDDEDKYVNLLSELRAIDENLFKLKRNKYNSSFYEFKSGPIYNKQQRKRL